MRRVWRARRAPVPVLRRWRARGLVVPEPVAGRMRVPVVRARPERLSAGISSRVPHVQAEAHVPGACVGRDHRRARAGRASGRKRMMTNEEYADAFAAGVEWGQWRADLSARPLDRGSVELWLASRGWTPIPPPPGHTAWMAPGQDRRVIYLPTDGTWSSAATLRGRGCGGSASRSGPG